MKEWGRWLRRTILVMLGAVLIGSSAGFPTLAADTEGLNNEEGTESQNPEGVLEENEENQSTSESATLIITRFEPLDQSVRVQDLKEGEEPQLPNTLDVTVAIQEHTGEEKTATGSGISNVVLTVGEVTQLPKSNITLSDVAWEITSTSESNSRVTETYIPEIPETKNGNDLEVMYAMTQLPVIQATKAVSQPSTTGQDNPTNEASMVSPQADDDIETKPPVLIAYGLNITGPDGSVVWSTVSNRIQIKQPGKYLIRGTLTDIPEEAQSSDQFIELMEPGVYNIALDSVNIDVSDMAYGEIFSIPSGATVNLSTRKGTAQLLCDPTDTYQTVIENKGDLNLIEEADVNCEGRVKNAGNIKLTGVSTLNITGTVTNDGTVEISESSKMGTLEFTNNGTLKINGEALDHSDVSTLTTTGLFRNNTGKTVTIDKGGLFVKKGPEKEDGTFDWLIENNGTMDLLNGGTAESRDVYNKSGGSITVNGNNSALKAVGTETGGGKVNGTLKNEGKLVIDKQGKAEAGVLQNASELTIGSGPENENSGSVTINTGGESTNTGTIVIEAGSVLNKLASAGTVTLKNDNSLTIKARSCLGEGNTQIDLAGEGEFIFAGLDSGMLHIPSDYEPAYDGENHTQDVAGITRTVDSTDKIEDTEGTEGVENPNPTKGIVTIDKEWKFNDIVTFEVRVQAELRDIFLTRAGEAPVAGGDSWTPGIEDADTVNNPSTHKAKVEQIQDPGDYELVYYDTKNPKQSCSVTFTMTPWSMIINTSRGDDEDARDKYGYKDGESAVYENKERITGTVQVAIFNEKSAGKGTVTLYWNAYNATSINDELTRNSGPLEIKLDNRGVGTVPFTIETADQDYILKPRLDPTDTDPSHPTWDNEDYAYKNPYQLTAVYQTSDGNTYHAGGDAQADHKVAGISQNLVGWYADKKLIVKRRISTINFTSNYYSLPHIYDGEPLQQPVKIQDVMIGNTNEDEPTYEWWKGTPGAVEEAYANKTTKVSGLENIQDDLAAMDIKAPKDAGWYIIEASLPSTSEYMGSKQLQLIRIEPRNATISIKDQHKAYGADDPAEWRDFVIGGVDAPTDLYVIDGLLPVDEGKMRGEITRKDDKDEVCGRYEIVINTWVEDQNDPTKDNYKLKQLSGYLTIDKRELDWDTDKMFMVITDDDTVSVVGGLKTEYHLSEGETVESVQKNLADDDVLVVYDKLDLSADKSKVTIDKPRLTGSASDNYVIQSKAIPVSSSNLYKVAVKAGGVDSTTLTKLQSSGYNTEEQIISEMETRLTGQGVPKGNIAVYDILLTKADGSQLTEEEIEQFPWGALTVTVPYPAGTSKSTSFMAAHMFTEDIPLDGPGMKPGNVETRGWNEVATVDQGVRFQVTSLSPISIGWSATTNNPNNPNNPNDPNGGNNGTNGGNNGTNGGNNGTNGGNNGTNSGDNNNNNSNNGTSTDKKDDTNKATTTNKASTTTKATSAQTGDTAQIAFYMIATLIACLLLILIIVLIRMQFRKKD